MGHHQVAAPLFRDASFTCAFELVVNVRAMILIRGNCVVAGLSVGSHLGRPQLAQAPRPLLRVLLDIAGQRGCVLKSNAFPG